MRYITTGDLKPLNFREANSIIYRRITRESVKLVLSAKRVDVVADSKSTVDLVNTIFADQFTDLPTASMPVVFDASDKVLLIIPHENNSTYDFWSISFNNGHTW